MMHVDWVEMGRRALELLQELLRIDTRNPPGNERPAAELVVQRLRASGLEPRMFEGQTNRTNVVCRIEGSGEGEPLLLAGHLDVVPVEEEHWDVPPFEGRIHNGYLYGRGAIDMKNHIAACVVIMQTLAELGVRPKRDIIFAAVADEEEGCRWGSQYMVEEHPDEVRAGWMIGEVGGFTLYLGDTCYYPIQVAEKGRTILKMTAHGEPGHGSMPHKAMAITRLGEALALLGSSRLPQHRSVTVDRFLRVLRQTQTPPNSLVLPRLNNPRLSGPILEHVLPPETAKSLSAALSNTVSPTILKAGLKSNVIPSEASCILDGRTLPGQTSSDLIAELRALLGDDLDFEVVQSFPSLEQPNPDSPLYRGMCSALTKHDPGSVPLPYLTVGFTDAQFFSRLGARCYGFSPMRFPKDDNVRFSELFHGHNERIHVEGFRWGVRVLWDVVRDFVL